MGARDPTGRTEGMKILAMLRTTIIERGLKGKGLT
jgi:hypothetical protein